MQSRLRRSFGLIGGVLILTAATFAQNFSFVSIDVPCKDCPGGIARQTAVGDINDDGEMVGNYVDAVGKQHGFLLRRGKFITIDVPGELVGSTGTLTTVALGISPSGDIVGRFTAPYNPPLSTTAPLDSPMYCPATGSVACIKGFVYSPHEDDGNDDDPAADADITHFRGITFPGHPGAIPARFTRNGALHGCLHDFDQMESMFSASWYPWGDASLMAGGGELADATASYPNSMHRGGTPDGRILVGFYVDMTVKPNHTHGYILQDGILTKYDVPDSTLTIVWQINGQHEMVGQYTDGSGVGHGFLQLPDGPTPLTFDATPLNAVSTVPTGINNRGDIVGSYTDSHGKSHGFLAVPHNKGEHTQNN